MTRQRPDTGRDPTFNFSTNAYPAKDFVIDRLFLASGVPETGAGTICLAGRNFLQCNAAVAGFLTRRDFTELVRGE
ncbi:MAG TPA: hypothetical protein VNT42_11530 [Sphingomonas sp.]|nr:hypothetical protein [Sphingomonas sp.]